MKNLINRLRNWFTRNNANNANTASNVVGAPIPKVRRSNAPSNFSLTLRQYFINPIKTIARSLFIGTLLYLLANYFLVKQPELYDLCPEFFDILKGYATVFRYILYSGAQFVTSLFKENLFKVLGEIFSGWGDLLKQFWAWLSQIRF